MNETYECEYAGCRVKTPANHFLCSFHYDTLLDGFLDVCPVCRRFKMIGWETCSDCRYGKKVKPRVLKYGSKIEYKLEHSDRWKKHNKDEGPFFTYILKLSDGTFYAGHTDDLRARLFEHRDGRTKSTAGRKPKLQYFEILPTRDDAVSREAELKKLCDNNPREIRRIIIEFGDYMDELEIE